MHNFRGRKKDTKLVALCAKVLVCCHLCHISIFFSDNKMNILLEQQVNVSMYGCSSVYIYIEFIMFTFVHVNICEFKMKYRKIGVHINGSLKSRSGLCAYF